ncbi:MAG: hypothetical protein ACOYJC_05390 [Christensenellales bacterium]
MGGKRYRNDLKPDSFDFEKMEEELNILDDQTLYELLRENRESLEIKVLREMSLNHKYTSEEILALNQFIDRLILEIQVRQLKQQGERQTDE